MSLLRPFNASDLFSFNNINLDAWTETYAISYYLQYLNQWGELFSVIESSNSSQLMGYVMGKTEGKRQDWHSHVSAITVSGDHRRLGLASKLMGLLEFVGDVQQNYFVDLFVRPSNTHAVSLYESLGYIIYRTVIDYYGSPNNSIDGEEDAYDMRKSLKRDSNKDSIKLPKGKKDGRFVKVSPDEIRF